MKLVINLKAHGKFNKEDIDEDLLKEEQETGFQASKDALKEHFEEEGFVVESIEMELDREGE